MVMEKEKKKIPPAFIFIFIFNVSLTVSRLCRIDERIAKQMFGKETVGI